MGGGGRDGRCVDAHWTKGAFVFVCGRTEGEGNEVLFFFCFALDCDIL